MCLQQVLTTFLFRARFFKITQEVMAFVAGYHVCFLKKKNRYNGNPRVVPIYQPTWILEPSGYQTGNSFEKFCSKLSISDQKVDLNKLPKSDQGDSSLLFHQKAMVPSTQTQ